LTSFYITYAIYRGRCPLAGVFRDAVSSHSDGFRGDELVGRFIGVRLGDSGMSLEGCIRVSFKQKELLDSLLDILTDLLPALKGEGSL
jgi:hypothetical protein